MKFDYTRAQETARKLLNKFGQKNTIKILTGEGAYDPAVGEAVKTYTDVSVLSVFLNYQADELPDNLVSTKTQKMICEDFTPKPVIDSEIVRDGVTYRVNDVQELKPADSNVIYIIRLAK